MRRSSFIAWLVGFLAILIAFIAFFITNPGYIYYWDLSGSFSFFEPFRQYFFLQNLYDGTNIAVANRIPIVSVIWLIYEPLHLLGLLGPSDVIKIAIILLYLSAFTVFYVLFPEWLKLFNKKIDENTLNSKKILIFRFIFSALYLIIPFFAYRVSQLHIFYMSAFYPLHIFLFIKLLESKKLEFKWIALFVISMFFGLATPHIIFMDLASFIVIFAIHTITSFKDTLKVLPNLIVTALLVVIASAYWLVPYFLVGSPEPGYVVTKQVLDMLAQQGTLWNFLVGQSEWFIDQDKLTLFVTQDNTIVAVQILGIILLYFFAIVAAFKFIKNKFVWSVLILLTLTALTVINTSPLHLWLFDNGINSPLGWIIREPNKLYMIWGFWVFLLATVGISSVFSSEFKKSLESFIVFSFLPAVIIFIITVYFLPINVRFLQYLKPIKIDGQVTKVFNLLEKDKDFFSVYYYPNNEPYVMNWKPYQFDIAETVNYRFLPYNSPKPPIYNSSVLPINKDFKTTLSEFLTTDMDKQDTDITPYLTEMGVKYIVVRKDMQSLTFGNEILIDQILTPTINYLENSKNFEKVLDNKLYEVYRNKNFKSPLERSDQLLTIRRYDDLLSKGVVDLLANYDLVNCNFVENSKTCFNNKEKQILVSENYVYFYIDFLDPAFREKYITFPYDHITEHTLAANWGKASFADKWNAELQNVLRNYELRVWNYDYFDKAVYSDKGIKEIGEVKPLEYSYSPNCPKNCDIYVKLLHSQLSGVVEIEINGELYQINAKTNKEENGYYWTKLNEEMVDFSSKSIKIKLDSWSGFNSVAGIMVVPNEMLTEQGDEFLKDVELVYAIEDLDQTAEIENVKKDCNIKDFTYTVGWINTIKFKANCPEEGPTYKLAATSYQFYYIKNGVRSVGAEVELDKGDNSVEIYLVNNYELLTWTLAAAGAIESLVLLLIWRMLANRKNLDAQSI